MHVLDDTYSITICKNDYEINQVHCLSIEEEEVKEVKEEEVKEEVEEEVKEEALEEEVEEALEEQVEEALEEVKERINSDEFVKLDKTNCIDF
jgi:ribosomal protein S3AE